MRPFRLLVLRRLIAACLAVCLGFFSAESLTAEVHDGDATHAELVRADGSREHGAAHRAGEALDRVADRAGAVAATASHAPDHGSHAAPHGGPSHGPGAPEHTTHVCHCGHGHVAPVTLLADAPARAGATVRFMVPAAGPAVRLSRADEPALRPPIG